MDNSGLMRSSTPKRPTGSYYSQNGTSHSGYHQQQQHHQQENPWAKIDELQRAVSDLALENEQLRSELILVNQQLVEKDAACMKIRQQFYGVVGIFEELYEKIRRMKHRQYMMKIATSPPPPTTTTTATSSAAAAAASNGPAV